MARGEDGPMVRKEWLIAMAIVAVALFGLLRFLVGTGAVGSAGA